MEIKKFEFNPFPENTYIVWDKDTKEGIIIDAGCYYTDEKESLSGYIQNKGINIKHLLATHLHLDHNFGRPYISKYLNIPLEASQKDEFLLSGMKEQASMFGMQLPDEPIPIGHYIDEGSEFRIGKYTIRTIAVPGHSPGSLVYYSPEAQVAFVGDVLFQGSIGRTDLPGGSYTQLVTGIKEKLFSLPNDTIVFSGHGPETTIGYEKENNPYLT